MDYFQAEQRLRSLNELISVEKSPRNILAKILQFILDITEDQEIISKEAFVSELLFKTKVMLKKYSAFGLEPESTKKILWALQRIINTEEYREYIQDWNNDIERIKNELVQLEEVLTGKLVSTKSKNKFYFPVLEKTTSFDYNYSLIDSLEISFLKNKKPKKTEFILHPSAVDVEHRIKTQIETSWEFAKNFFNQKYNKRLPNFQILIKFENSYAIYEGGSLGIALTIGFISELLRFFDLRDEINFLGNIISSGSVSLSGETESMEKEILCTKLKAVFFSPFSIFVVPKNNEIEALNCYSRFKAKYPQKRLDIIGVKDLYDIINRRNIIELKKKIILSWGIKRSIKNRVINVFMLTFLLFALAFVGLRFDNNPYYIDFEPGKLLVKNQFNRTLWSKASHVTRKALNTVHPALWNRTKIIDFNNDGTNEILVSLLKDNPALVLLNSNGEEIWRYTHFDSISTRAENFTGLFVAQGIIDTIKSGNHVEVLAYFQHHNYYPTVIARIDLLTGKKIGEKLWHPGSIGGAILNDIDNDGIREIIAGGASNGMNRAYLFAIDFNKLIGTFPTSENYSFQNTELADFDFYILFPKTDFAEYFFPKYNAVLGKPIIINDQISVTIYEGKANLFEADYYYNVKIRKDLSDFGIILSDGGSNVRDKLVNEGTLKPPLTDTFEYRISIKNRIQKWNGSEFASLLKKDTM